MTEADVMFESLGYRKKEKESEIIYRHYKYNDLSIRFHLDSRCVDKCAGMPYYIEGFSFEELMVVVTKCRELNWSNVKEYASDVLFRKAAFGKVNDMCYSWDNFDTDLSDYIGVKFDDRLNVATFDGSDFDGYFAINADLLKALYQKFIELGWMK